MKVGDIEINALTVLGRAWGSFTEGITSSEFLTLISKEYSLSVEDAQGIWNATNSLLGELSLHQVTKLEQRRRGGTVRGKIDIDYWVLTDYGKTVVLKLRRESRQ